MAGLDSSMVLNVSNLWAGVKTVGTTGDKPTFASGPTAATSVAGWDFDQDSALGFDMLGHTSEESEVSLSPDISGGEKLNSLQRSALRETATRAAWSLTLPTLQLDNTVLTLIFGGGNTTEADYFGVPKTYATQRRELLLVFGDSAGYNMPIWIPQGSIKPEGEITLSQSGLTEAPLSIGILDLDAADDLFGFFRAGLGTPA